MPPRRQIAAKLSARAVYAKQTTARKPRKGRVQAMKSSPSPSKVNSKLTAKKDVKQGSGRAKKAPTSLVDVKPNLRSKKSPKTQKRKISVSFNSTTEVIDNHSSEADLSSEGEETDQSNEDLVDVEQKEVEQRSEEVDQIKEEQSDDNEILDNENELKVEEKVELPDEVDDIDEDISEEEVSGDEKIVTTDEIKEKQCDSEDVCFSFPAPQSSSNFETANGEQEETSSSEISDQNEENGERISQVEKVLKSKKRKVTQETTEETEGELKEIRRKKKKKKKSFGRANLPVKSDARTNSPQQHFNSNRVPHSSTDPFASFHTIATSPHPCIDSVNSMVRLNKTVSCGNIASDQAFRWLIGPTLPVDFFRNVYEKMPFSVRRKNRQYYKDLFSGNDLHTMLKDHNLEYQVHLDIVKYVNGIRIPVLADGRAYYSNVWEDYKQGYSLRVRNPQTYNRNLWKLCSLLQEYFSSTVGCNVYLTPPKAQGFPPHYDDIDAFIIQVEGRKHWQVYAPRFPEEELARYSSKDFSKDEIGNPILEVCLNAGEMLYIPRGYIHQAATDDTVHSLHLTFSTNQLNTWGDLLLLATQKAVEKAMLNDVTFRESISKDYMDHLGSSVAESKAFKRHELVNKLKDLAKKAMSYIDADEAADLHSIKFMETSLPPVFSKIEKDHSLHGNGSYWKNGTIHLKEMIGQDTEIQLIKKRNLRLVIGDHNPRLYHNFENARDPKPAQEGGSSATYVEFEMDAVPSYLFLLKKYPVFVRVKDIPLEDEEDRISFATSLYENGVVMTKKPLPHIFDDLDWTAIPDIIAPSSSECS